MFLARMLLSSARTLQRMYLDETIDNIFLPFFMAENNATV